MAGCGVVFKLTQAIAIRLNMEEKEFLKYLDIVCVGTISDIVPLVDENRVIAKLGLKLACVTRNPGLRALLAASGYKDVNSNAVSFGIAPRINACGRMGHEEEALKLFLTENIVDAGDITEKLNQYNRTRQEIEKNIYYCGLNDANRVIFDELIPLEHGTTYNSYLIKGSEKTALIDTMYPPFSEEYLKNLDNNGITNVDYIIANHGEQDHSGTIPALLEKFPNAKITKIGKFL